MNQLTTIFDFKTVIFDSSTPQWKVKLWKTDCKKLGIDFVDTRINGAFILKIEGKSRLRNF